MLFFVKGLFFSQYGYDMNLVNGGYTLLICLETRFFVYTIGLNMVPDFITRIYCGCSHQYYDLYCDT